MSEPNADAVAEAAERATPDIVRFLRALIAIPSESGEERRVVERARQEMETLGFDEVRIDGLGNLLGRLGNGSATVALDGHLDTVGVGDPSTWSHDPYQGAVRDGIVYGRGAGDQEGGFAAAVYGAAIARDLGLLEDVALWVTGTVLEEDCDGLCWQYLLGEEVLRPDVVVITEPTNLGVYRGQRGRMEIEVRTQGRSAHGSMPDRGINAVYAMAPIISGIEGLHRRLAAAPDPFLGPGTATISEIRSTSPSLCAVADSCSIHVDRRLTRGETIESAMAEIQALPEVRDAGATVRILDYSRASYTGLVYPTRKYYPSWVLEESDPAIVAAVRAAELALGEPPRIDRWSFSTNGVATCGLHGIPTVGFGPGDEATAHTPDDQCPVAHLTAATRFYARFPRLFAAGR